ncbi:hypothetical protein EYF80_005786 [Liparis tanakae]|uniref:Uncharacterized protein n=1 Tax=Liparis tanakae TaxID=230148 RepID=A0A4Z2J0Q7_9TELE|nr:hypothetical protein EYF80_005786 [Liparis tanakae]
MPAVTSRSCIYVPRVIARCGARHVDVSDRNVSRAKSQDKKRDQPWRRSAPQGSRGYRVLAGLERRSSRGILLLCPPRQAAAPPEEKSTESGGDVAFGAEEKEKESDMSLVHSTLERRCGRVACRLAIRPGTSQCGIHQLRWDYESPDRDTTGSWELSK